MLKVLLDTLSEKEGGRQSPFYNSRMLDEDIQPYRPNLVFGFPGQLSELKKNGKYFFEDHVKGLTKSIDCIGIFPSSKEVYPGATTEAEVIIRDTDYIDEFLNEGENFLVREGGSIVATGKIEKVMRN